MITLSLPSGNNVYHNLYTLTGYTAGTSIQLTNNGIDDLFVIEQSSQPTTDSRVGFPIKAGQSATISRGSIPVWIASDSSSNGNFIVQQIRGTGTTGQILPVIAVQFPEDLLTKGEEGFRRLRIDAAQTSFFRGRQFRSYLEFSVASGTTQIIKFTSAVDFVLFDQTLTVNDGDCRFAAITGASDATAFNTSISVIGKNRMAIGSNRESNYASQVTLATGGTITGGTEVEVFRVKTASATAQQSTVGGSQESERGLPAGTYYLKLQNMGAGTMTGVYYLWWEERD